MATMLTVLGGSAASVGTGQGCSGYLVSTETCNVVLDLGPDTLLELRKHTDFRALGAVVLSHLHVDHMLDIVALRFSLAYNPIEPDRRTPLWVPPGGLEFFDKVGEVFSSDFEPDDFFGKVFEINEYDPDGSLQLGDLVVSFAPTVHFVPCWAIRVHPMGDGGDLLYTADTGPSADLRDFAHGSRIVIAEASTPTAERDIMPFVSRGHLTAVEAAELARNAGAAILTLTHMFEENDPTIALAEAATVFHGEIVHAQPGARITWS